MSSGVHDLPTDASFFREEGQAMAIKPVEPRREGIRTTEESVECVYQSSISPTVDSVARVIPLDEIDRLDHSRGVVPQP